jgi:serine/threonine-protein kinase
MSRISPERWQALSPYLDQALETTVAELPAWLEALRVKDSSLVADLETLLEERAAAGREGFLEAGPLLPGPTSWIGQTLGGYTVVALLGQGGMGSVWLAQRSDGWFVGKAALKVLRADVLGSGSRERFKREGSILGRLQHPHIAHLLDAGVSATGQPYLLLEYIEGQRIDAYCDERALGLEARVRLVLDVAAAVAHAHAKLIVHRDIKASNVLVTGDGRVKLLDFGIAKLLEPETLASMTSTLTRDSGRALTPECAAPEQLTGDAITTATDVYALGVLLYTLLGGCHPAGGAQSSPAELLRAIIETDPPRLPHAVRRAPLAKDIAARRATTPERLERALSGDLETIVAKALKKNPEERYGSVSALADDLRRYLGHEPIRARADTLGYRTAKFVRRHRLSVALTTVVSLALLAGLGGTLWHARAAAQQRDLALVQLRRAESTAAFTAFVFGQAPNEQAPMVRSILGGAEHLAEKRLADDDALGVRLLTTIGGIYTVREEADNARRVLKRAYEAAQSVSDPGVRALATCYWARVVASDGDFTAGRHMIEQALTLTSDEVRFDNVVADCLVTKANIAMDEGAPEVVLDAGQRALARLRNSPAALPETRLDAMVYLALASSMQGDTSRADGLYAQAFEQAQKLGRQDTPDVGVLLHNWAMNTTLTDTLAALGQHERVIALFEAATPGSVPMPVRLNHAIALNRLARHAEARRAHEAVAVLARRHDSSTMRGLSALGLACACRGLGDLGCARTALTEADAALRTFPPGHRARADLAREQGLLAAAEGHDDAARRLLTGALAIHAQVAEKHVSHIETLLALARLELRTGAAAAAEQHTRAALALAERLRGASAHSAWVGLSQLALGEVQEARQARAAAQNLFRDALAQLAPTLGGEHPAVREAQAHLSAASASKLAP